MPGGAVRGIAGALAILAAVPSAAEPPIEIVVDRDDVVVATSCRLRIADRPIADRHGDGVVRIVADGVHVEIGGTLRGAAADADPDTFRGIGIVVAAKNVTLSRGGVAGFKVGVVLEGADGTTVEHLDLSDNFAERLRSTPDRESAEDWLRPHENDAGEWADRYGAGLLVRDSREVVVRNLFVRRTQNGILLERVERSEVYDNDCSFLSGWGLALWRSSFNVVARNAFDFCVRGYSHGVYNRGQDSAGILLFEQCVENVIALNSATHGGDGIFSFAGREALGEVPRRDGAADPAPDPAPSWHLRRGNRGNRFVGNDVSHAVAHGIESTFSHDVTIARNRMESCGICGVWAGYSADTLILGNDFVGNGRLGYGLERGGVNIEHGRGNLVLGNRFDGNACGVRLWWDEDPHLATLPWSLANGTASRENVVAGNVFDGDEIAVELARTEETLLADNRYLDVGTELVADESSRDGVRDAPPPTPETDLDAILRGLPGTAEPIGARRDLDGRERILMTEWGPYDWERPLLATIDRSMALDRHRLLGADLEGAMVFGAGSLRTRLRGDGIVEVICERPGRVCPYRLRVVHEGGRFETEGLVAPANWRIRLFPSPTDPREDAERWRAAAEADVATLLERGGALLTVSEIDFDFGMAGPAAVPALAADEAARSMPADGFGLVAETTLVFPPGRWRLRTVSDDGVRLLRDDEVLIERWDRHGATEDVAELRLDEETAVDLRIEWFELDGAATLRFDLERLGD